MAIVAITTADKFVTSVLKSVALEVSIFHRALHPLLMRLLWPVWACIIVEGRRSPEVAMKNLCLAINVVLNFCRMNQVEIVLMHSKGVVFNRTLGDWLADRNESLLIDFAHRLAMLIPDDVPVSYLLVDRWVVDQCTSSVSAHHWRLLLDWAVEFKVFDDQVALVGCWISAYDTVVHPLEIIVGVLSCACGDTFLSTLQITGGIGDDKFIGRNSVILRGVFVGDAATEGRNAAAWLWLTASAMQVA